MQKITTYLWFDNNAEEAMKFYTSVFKNSKIVSIHRYPAEPLLLQMQKIDIAGLRRAYKQG